MEHLSFKLFAGPVNAKFEKLANNTSIILAYTKVDMEELYEHYQAQYPKELNTIFRTRRHYDGSYDRNFIKRLGNVVGINADGTLDSIWNVKVPDYFQPVADAMHKLVTSQVVDTIFLTDLATAGNPSNKDGDLDIVWDHFYSVIPHQYVKKGEVASLTGTFNEDVNVFTRGLKELTLDALETDFELIEANTLYRGTEHKKAVSTFIDHKKKYDTIPAAQQAAYILYTARTVGPAVRFKNTVIGTLVEDISNGVELNKAVGAFQDKVAPGKFKVPTSIATVGMISAAAKTMDEIGGTPALERRFATIKDIDVNNVLFTNQTQKALNVFDDLQSDAKSAVKPQALAKVEEISLDHFLENIVPSAKTVEVLFENKHANNLVTLITAVNADAAHLFKWDNPFSWSYNGEVADSLRDKVQALGGRVDGVLRFSHSWNHDGKNQSLMDLHVFGPNCKLRDSKNSDEIHDDYPLGLRVGWNNRKDNSSGGVQDVDFTTKPGDKVPVENITFPSLNKLPDGKYTFKIHNWSAREPNLSGFKAEIEFENQVFGYEYTRPLKNKQWITVAEATLKNGKFTIEHKLDSEASSKNIWGLDTNRWVKVNNILLSPNMWNEEKRTGNEHLFFIVDNCKNPHATRGIYNEFLRSEFEPHRKVFELLAHKTKAQSTDEQASGLGFSSTRRDKVTVRVTGKTQRTFVINL